MSGLCGIVAEAEGAISKADLDPMLFSLAHRGPHGRGTWADATAVFGHLALRTTPESHAERLPWRDSESGLVITADTRLDNRSALFDRLGSKPNHEIPDSQLILQAYLRWGSECVQQFSGDFAFAIWSSVERSLFCARDHLGKKPLCYGVFKGRFIFASSAVAVANAPGSKAVLNEGRVADFLLQESEGIDQSTTFFLDIFRLPPASRAIWQKGRLVVQNYWNPEPGCAEIGLNDEECQSQFRATFGASVLNCLRSDQPVASMLSGGIDSSTVVGVAARQREQNRTAVGDGYLAATVSQVSDDAANDEETTCIKAVAKHCGISSYLMGSDFLEHVVRDIDTWLDHLEDPFDGTMLQRYALYLVAGNNGHRVVLDGVDGDMVASLPVSYPGLMLKEGQWLHGVFEAVGQWRNYYDRVVPIWSPVISALRSALAMESLKEKRHEQFLEAQLTSYFETRLIKPEFAEKVDLRGRYRRYHDTLKPRLVPEYGALRAAQVARVRAPYLTAGIERYERVAAFAGIEPRHPMLDIEFVDLCLSLPREQLCQNGWTKIALRRLAAEVVPEKVAWRRSDGGLDWQYHSRWRKSNRGQIVSRLTEGKDRLSEWIDWSSFSNSLKSFNMDQSSRDWGEISRIYHLNNWLKSNF